MKNKKAVKDKWDLLSDCCHADFDPMGFPNDQGLWDEKCLKCGKLCDVTYMEIPVSEIASMEIKYAPKNTISVGSDVDDKMVGESIKISQKPYLSPPTSPKTPDKVKELKNGEWVESEPLPYYPSLGEIMLHKIGIHVWTYQKPFYCVMCGKEK